MKVDTLSFLAKAAINLKAVNFPVLTARRRAHKTTDLEVLMLGDSHGWGQGSPGYDVIFPVYSAHMAVPYSKGFFAGLREHIAQKYDFYVTPILPGRGNQAGKLNLVSGIYKEIEVDVPTSVSAAGFYAPRQDEGQAAAHLGYLAFRNKFSEKLIVLAPDNSGSAQCQVDMLTHASKVYIGVLSGRSGAKLEVYFEQQGIDGGYVVTDQGTVRRGNTAGCLYPQADGYPIVTRIEHGEHRMLARNEAAVTESSVVIDTFNPDGNEEVVYCIDYGQKQQGRLCFAYAGANPDAVTFEHPECSCEVPVLRLRGIIFDGNDVRNFSMGGHTVGQWLGDGTPSFNDPSYSHVDELLCYVPFTPTLTIIQAPIVNEYLRQTPIDTFTANLTILLDKLSQHHNREGTRRMDVLLLTTPGDKLITYEGGASAPIGYGEYYDAVKQFAAKNGYGFVDFEHYFRECVAAGLLDYEFLFDDYIHPGPYANEFIREMLSEIIDLIM